MKLLDLKKIHEGKFLTYYIAEYLNEENNKKKYEFISRNKKLSVDNFGKTNPCGIGMVVYSPDREKVLIQKEFRLACNNWVYCFTTGLIDEGETAEDAAIRELKEETGVSVVRIEKVLPISYASAPISDEAMRLVICVARGEVKKSISCDEEIVAKWYTKDEIRELFKEEVLMSVRTQMFLWDWINS